VITHVLISPAVLDAVERLAAPGKEFACATVLNWFGCEPATIARLMAMPLYERFFCPLKAAVYCATEPQR